MTRILCASLLLLFLGGCLAPPPVDRLASLRQGDGTLVWQGEYAFVSPGGDWQLITLDEDDYSLAFSKSCDAFFPCQSTLAYAEEPFGYSRDLERRQEEFFKRYLWASRVVFAAPHREKTTFNGSPALIATIEGVEPVKGQKVWSKVLFGFRGERVVAFHYNQWRPASVPFDLDEVADFDRFVASFRFLKPSFFELL